MNERLDEPYRIAHLEVDNDGQWEIGDGKLEVGAQKWQRQSVTNGRKLQVGKGNGESEMASGRCEIGNKWGIGSGEGRRRKWGVGSGKFEAWEQNDTTTAKYIFSYLHTLLSLFPFSHVQSPTSHSLSPPHSTST
jgi:hypothetical protein